MSAQRVGRHTARSRQTQNYTTCVVLGLEVQLVQLVDVADVHLLFVQLRLVEVLQAQKRHKSKVLDNTECLFILVCQYFVFYINLYRLTSVRPLLGGNCVVPRYDTV